MAIADKVQEKVYELGGLLKFASESDGIHSKLVFNMELQGQNFSVVFQDGILQLSPPIIAAVALEAAQVAKELVLGQRRPPSKG